MKDWLQVLAAVVTVAGGLGLVWWQTSEAGEDNKDLLRDFNATLQNSVELRAAVLRPLEGRWSYQLTWDRYFSQVASEAEGEEVFVAEGTADIRWSGGSYHVLLGYENRDDATGKVYSVGVSVGTLRSGTDGAASVGDSMIMRYAHRLSTGVVEQDRERIDYSRVPEKTYTYTITDLGRSSNGDINEIQARFEVPISAGDVVFIREQ